ncbi:hypothetical protein EVAR_71358_1 [Eumeta japonica]|uniref:Integrase catalytic domain-containing protein n=1 Tax=Eumeta variegata TaxID=151549 RepID=A0A4C1SNC6_EUMVA|nr:hypothetical protein EVAR_71358_1 [Eumeta japonica]
MSIRNFISRRGTPREIYSDNGTNFKAAERILVTQLKKVNVPEIKTTFEQIKWKFNPPSSPHMGGAWERLIKSVKLVLYNICPSMKFTDESLKSALCEAEFTVNSRPLTWYKTQFADQFWRRWLKDYVPVISRRTKWFTKLPPIKIGDIVVSVDPDLPRNCWPKGKVIDVVLAKDGQVRRATVKTIHGIYHRPTAKLAVLDVSGTLEGKLDPSTSFTEEELLPLNQNKT